MSSGFDNFFIRGKSIGGRRGGRRKIRKSIENSEKRDRAHKGSGT